MSSLSVNTQKPSGVSASLPIYQTGKLGLKEANSPGDREGRHSNSAPPTQSQHCASSTVEGLLDSQEQLLIKSTDVDGGRTVGQVLP